MNDVLLINKVDPEDKIEIKKRIFLVLDKESLYLEDSKLMDILNQSDILDEEDVLYKHNGIEVSMRTKDIPKLVKILTDENIAIYSIFERYNPRL